MLNAAEEHCSPAGAAREPGVGEIWLAGRVVIGVALNATAALMALFVIKPLRRAFILGNDAAAAEAAARNARTA